MVVSRAIRRFRAVPRFISLRDVVRARKMVQQSVYQPGPERDDLEERLRRHSELLLHLKNLRHLKNNS